LKELGLKIADKNFTIERAIKNEKRFFMPLCVDKDGKKYFLKARFQDTQELIVTLKKEIEFCRKIEPIISSQDPHFITPRFIKSGEDKRGYIWLLREYLEGKFYGVMDTDFGFLRSFFTRVDPQDFALKILSYQKKTNEIKRQMAEDGFPLDRHGQDWYMVDYNFYRHSKSLETLIPRETVKVGKILEKNRELIEKNASVITHGDFYPNNILITEKGETAVIDWELIHLNNLCFDIAFGWMNSFRDPCWQEKYLKAILANVKDKAFFKKLFPVVVASLCLRFIHATYITISTFRYGYKDKLVSYGYRSHQIRGTIRRAKEAQNFHLKVLRKILRLRRQGDRKDF